MSLYIEAASILNETSGSLRSRIYHRPASSPQLKSPPARLYALIIETLKHQEILNEVIAKSELLKLERKVLQLPLPTTNCPAPKPKLAILLHLFSAPKCSR
jgi:putative methyltransferase